MIQNLQFVKDIHKGSASVIRLFELPSRKFAYAIKIIDKSKLTQEKKNQIVNEINILKKYKNQYIIKHEEVKEDQNYYIIRMEYCSGGTLLYCLKEYIKKYKKPFPENFVRHIFSSVVIGLQFLHQNNIIHRNLTNKNIFVKFYNPIALIQINMLETKIKIGGFDYSIDAHYTNNNQNDLLNAKRKDIYSLGVLCSELIFGAIVRNKQDYLNLKNNNQIGYSIPSTLSSKIFDFVNKMLDYDKNKQLTIDQISNHPFLKEDINNFDYVNLDVIFNKNNINTLQINNKNSFGTSSMFTDFVNVNENASSNKNINNINRNIPIMPFPLQKNNNINQNHNNLIYINNSNQSNQVIKPNNNLQQQAHNINTNKNKIIKNNFGMSNISVYSSTSTIIDNSSSQVYSFSDANQIKNNNHNEANSINQSSQNKNSNVQNSNNYINLNLNNSNISYSQFYKNNKLSSSYIQPINMNNNFSRQLFGSGNNINMNINNSYFKK